MILPRSITTVSAMAVLCATAFGAIGSVALQSPAEAKDATARKGGRILARGQEGPRDMNMFQLEPTVINESYYTSGKSERHQKISPTLPEGAPIPDRDNYCMPSKEPAKDTSKDNLERKLSKDLLKKVGAADKSLRLKLKVGSCDGEFVTGIEKIDGLKVLNINKETNEITVTAGESAVKNLADLKNVSSISEADE